MAPTDKQIAAATKEGTCRGGRGETAASEGGWGYAGMYWRSWGECDGISDISTYNWFPFSLLG